ncbi:methyl-accepting chemotaxis protein [Rhizobium sp. SGZ-381]|uniref:methyl-accepting chemotaxis protein n=1 Tax=Rhizobium sp. SGZ-381 TaxID=3342800 RepID=UPI003670D2F4
MQRSPKSLTLTAKLAAIIVAINLAGMLGLSFYTWRSESASMLEDATESWSKDSAQFASLASGGVKWGKAEAVAETYALYRDDANLNLVQFTAYGADLKPVNSWSRSGPQNLPTDADLAKAAGTRPEKPRVDMSAVGNGYVTVVAPLPLDKGGKASGYVVTTWSAESILAEATHKTLLALSLQFAIIAIAIAVFILTMGRIIGQPLKALSGRITGLQAGDLDTPVPYRDRGDEIGFLARALEGFRNDAVATLEQRRLAEEQQRTLNEERLRNAAQTQATAATQNHVMQTLGLALERVAKGNLDTRLDNLGPEFDKLRLDFNAMVASITRAVGDIKTASFAVETGASGLAGQAEQLAQRTERQAASLEETAAALGQVTSTVRTSSHNAETTGAMIAEAKAEAQHSAHVVRNAIGAMDRIQQSSSQIGQIISVIDEIAFQTNLLALNAGVEAARAGEAGKGFAVVAQEVRELAQRSANAAKQIKTLIDVSNSEVSGGVELVNQTGDALLKIESHIARINDGILVLVDAYRQQASGLQEINGALNNMDQTTQQNAAMVEETSAACHELLSQSQLMQDAANRFQLSPGAPSAHAARHVA